jgi:RNA-binding protein YhbY
VASDVDDDSVGAGADLGGAKRRALRALAGRLAADGKLKTILVLGVDFTAQFLGKIDRALDECELVKLRLRDVASKKEVKVVAEDIATGRAAHVAQVVGHTALLYRARDAKFGPPRVTFDEAGKAHMQGPSTVGEELELEALDAVFSDEE